MPRTLKTQVIHALLDQKADVDQALPLGGEPGDVPRKQSDGSILWGPTQAKTTSVFTQPASGSPVPVVFTDTSSFAEGQLIYIENGGHYEVLEILNETAAMVENLGLPENAGAGSNIPTGSRVGAGGATGPTGATGAPGVDGRTIHNGSGAPSGALGANGDIYIDTDADEYYVKASGSWGSPTPLIGPQGIQGPAGAGSAPQVKNNNSVVVAVPSDIDFSSAFSVTASPASEANIAPTFGTAAGTIAQGNDSRITGAVQTTRTISTTAPLAGGGDLSANRTLSVSAASDTAQGVVELATSAETTTGTDATRATTPASVKAVADTKAALTHASQHNPGGSDVIQRFDTRTFTFKGTLPTANGTTTGTLRVPIPSGITATIVNVTGTINVNPTGAGSSQTLDIKRSGTSIYSAAAKISFTPGGSQFQNGATPDTTALTGGTHYLTVDLVTAGSPSAGGSDIVLDIRFRYT